MDSREKMRFSLKTLRADVRYRARTYSQSVIGKPYFHQPSHGSYFLVIELCFDRIELMIGLFTVFEVVKPQGKYMEELYGPGE